VDEVKVMMMMMGSVLETTEDNGDDHRDA